MSKFRVPHLRTLLRANAVFASTTGVVALAATGPIARLMGVGQHRLVSATGAGLVLFAVGLVISSGAPPRRLVAIGRLISSADALWVVGSLVVVAVGVLTTAGNLIVSAIAVIVTAFAALQLRAGALVDRGATNQTVEVSRVLTGSREQVWAVVIDHEAYGRLAPNLSRVMATGPDGPALTRRCWDSRGRHWDEACVLWDDHHRFAVEVETAAEDYPYPLEYLRGEWSLRPVGGDRTEVTIRFELRPKPGAAGAAFATAMTTGAKPLLRRIMSGWQELVAASPMPSAPSDGDARLSS